MSKELTNINIGFQCIIFWERWKSLLRFFHSSSSSIARLCCILMNIWRRHVLFYERLLLCLSLKKGVVRLASIKLVLFYSISVNIILRKHAVQMFSKTIWLCLHISTAERGVGDIAPKFLAIFRFISTLPEKPKPTTLTYWPTDQWASYAFLPYGLQVLSSALTVSTHERNHNFEFKSS